VEKIIKKITKWATKSTSYAGRVPLINSVLMGVFNFSATVFILPKVVIKELERRCMNYLWGGDEVYKRMPYVSWEETCQSNKCGGLGIRNMEAWNKASIAKLVWVVAKTKDLMWVRWVYERYMKNKPWWEYTLRQDMLVLG